MYCIPLPHPYDELRNMKVSGKLYKNNVAIFTGRNICCFNLFYYFVTLSYNLEERQEIVQNEMAILKSPYE